MAGKVPPSMEKLRTKTEYELANDPLGLSPTAAEKIVNRLSGKFGIAVMAMCMHMEYGPVRLVSERHTR